MAGHFLKMLLIYLPRCKPNPWVTLVQEHKDLEMKADIVTRLLTRGHRVKVAFSLCLLPNDEERLEGEARVKLRCCS